jgi:hypothetical protein
MHQRGIPLTARWARFGDGLDKRIRDRLYNFMRYCSARGIGPSAVDDTIFDEYWHYRIKTTARASNNTARRFMVRAWNACADAIGDWSLRLLTEPPIKVAEPAWDAFPKRMRTEIEEYLAGLAQVHRTLNGNRIQPCAPTTIATRRAELVAMARMAVRIGMPMESLSSLGALLHPDVVEQVIDAYWRKNGERKPAPSTSARKCCGWPARQVASINLPLIASTRSESRLNTIATRP